MLLLHRRDDGQVAEELFFSTRGPADSAGTAGWTDCDHLGGGLLGFDPADPAAVAEVLAGRATAVVSASESLVYTGRVPMEDDGYELVCAVRLLVGPEAGFLEEENVTDPAGPARHHRRLASPLALAVLLPGDRLRVRAARAAGAAYEPVGDGIALAHPYAA
ncbi:hypothetical protein [Streptomyces sp. NPDC049881]|uniref:hypothetical protein n=1 Tax=Streptomyces sp. NPDC049881 TaxID=3155778 RepID=UPI0034177BF8